MDIVDVLFARALTPQGQIGTYAAQAEKAVRDAAQAVSDIQTITEQTNANNASAAAALATVNEALENLDTVGNLQDIADREINKLLFSLSNSSITNSIITNLSVQYPNEATSQLIGTCVKYYTTTGQNTDGTMTQKAITDAISNALNGIIAPEAGSINLGAENANKVVIVGEDGRIIASAAATEEMILNGTGNNNPSNNQNSVNNTGIVGIRINYANGTSSATDDAINATTSTFDSFSMYGGRRKCIVNDDGEIIAFYGDNEYTDTSSNNYQVMVYQPKFYYKRNILQTINSSNGAIVREEILQLSPIARTGFKLHPLFIDQNNNELEYVLLSAYEGSIASENETSYQDIQYTDFINQKLASVSNAKPICGTNNELTVINAEHLAQNRGNTWHILNTKAISAIQMLQLVEFNAINGQVAFNDGICQINAIDETTNQSALTGATQLLGNQSGQANSTIFNYNNTQYAETAAGRSAIAYRGYENPWGNVWQFVGDILITRTRNQAIPYLCLDYNYATTINNNYRQLTFTLPTTIGWASGFGYDSNYDWLYLPVELNDSANSLSPIGDFCFGVGSDATINCCLYGGPWFGESNNGPFYYSYSYNINSHLRSSNARLMLIPQFNSNTYLNNYIKWNTNVGG